MEKFSALLALRIGNSSVTDEFPSQKPVTQSFDAFLICAWINGWVNNREAGDLRRHRALYDVTVIIEAGAGSSPAAMRHFWLTSISRAFADTWVGTASKGWSQ